MTNWDDYRIFLAVVSAGSLTTAARKLGVSQPTVGRRLSALERRLGTRLFDRTKAGLRLTAAGSRVLGAAMDLEASAVAIERGAGGDDDALAGRVRLSTTEGFAAFALMPRLAELATTHPGIMVELDTSLEPLDLTRSGMDIVLRFSRPVSTSLVGRRIAQSESGLYASEDYLARWGCPGSVSELAQHRVVRFGGEMARTTWRQWLDDSLPTAPTALVADSMVVARHAVVAGIGIATLPRYLAPPGSRRLLPRAVKWRTDLWLLGHPDSRRRSRVREVMSWLAATLAGMEL